MKRSFALAGLLIAAMLCFSACGGSSSSSQPKSQASSPSPSTTGSATTEADALAGLPDVNWTIAHSGAEDSWNQAVGIAVAEKLAEYSGGKITASVHPSGQLGSDKDMILSAKTGDITMHICSTAPYVNDVSGAAVIDIPFLYDNIKAARATISDENFQTRLKADYEKAGFKLLMVSDQGFRCITTNKKIEKFEDLAGQTLRTMENSNHIDFFKNIGVNATPLNFSELYMSLQQGLMDGQENPYRTILASKFYEVQKYLTNSNHIVQCNTICMGADFYNNLPQAYQEIVNQVMADVLPYAYDFADRTIAEDIESLVGYGMEFIDFDQIPNMRQSLKDATVDKAIERVSATVDPELLEAFLTAASVK